MWVESISWDAENIQENMCYKHDTEDKDAHTFCILC